MGKRVTEDDKAKFRELRQKGYDAVKIGDMTDWKASTVRAHWGDPNATPAEAPSPTAEGGDTPGVTPPDTPSQPLPQDAHSFLFDDTSKEIYQLVDDVCTRIGMDKEKKNFIVGAIKTTPQYQDQRGMFHFLINAKVGGGQANMIVEQAFGMQMHQYGQQGGQQPNQFLPAPIQPQYPQNQYPPQMNPMQPQLPMQWNQSVPSTQGYVMTPSGPVLQMIPTPGQPGHFQAPIADKGMTQADVDQAVREEVDKIREKDSIEDKFDQLNGMIQGLAKKLSEGGTSEGSYTEEKIPIQMEDGSIAKDPESGEILYRIIASKNQQTVQQNPMETQVLGMMRTAFDQMVGGDNSGVTEQMTQIQQSLKTQELQLIEEKSRNQLLTMEANMKAQLAEIQHSNQLLAARIQGQPQQAVGMSEDGQVAIKGIDLQGQVILKGMDNLNHTVKEGLGIVKEMLKTPAPEGRSQVHQWTNDELNVFNTNLER